MINGEKYRDKLLKFIEERDAGSFTFSKGERGKFWQCGGRRCSECGMSKERSNCSVARLKWLLSEYKEPIKVSKLEYEILKYVKKEGFHYIARNENWLLVVHEAKPTLPTKYVGWCSCGKSFSLYGFEGLFQFVKWSDEKPTSIKGVLDNCEVVEDDL